MTRVGFCVVYRFRISPDGESAFRDGWRRLTHAIRETRGGLGSRLHQADDGLWLAYAQWPDRASWERSRETDSPDEEAAALMMSVVTERFPPLLLDPVDDLLEPHPAGPASPGDDH